MGSGTRGGVWAQEGGGWVQEVGLGTRGSGGRISSTKHVNKLHSIFRYAESLRGFTEIKQVTACSIQVCRGSMEFNAWNTFVLRVEHPYIVRVLQKSLDMGELTFHAEKTACC